MPQHIFNGTQELTIVKCTVNFANSFKRFWGAGQGEEDGPGASPAVVLLTYEVADTQHLLHRLGCNSCDSSIGDPAPQPIVWDACSSENEREKIRQL